MHDKFKLVSEVLKRSSLVGIVAIGVFGTVGCNDAAVSETPQLPTARPLGPIQPLQASAGVPVAPAQDPNFDRSRQLADAKEFGRRGDAFSLLATERAYERNQQVARTVTEYGGWFGQQFEEPDATAAEQVVVEPQPYRRLSGILLGNGVSALIEMENGRVYEVVPGSQIPGTNWVVISIDGERAILRRGGSTLPKEIIVRLGPRLNEFLPGGGGGGGAQQGDGDQPSGPGRPPRGAGGAGGR